MRRPTDKPPERELKTESLTFISFKRGAEQVQRSVATNDRDVSRFVTIRNDS